MNYFNLQTIQNIKGDKMKNDEYNLKTYNGRVEALYNSLSGIPYQVKFISKFDTLMRNFFYYIDSWGSAACAFRVVRAKFVEISLCKMRNEKYPLLPTQETLLQICEALNVDARIATDSAIVWETIKEREIHPPYQIAGIEKHDKVKIKELENILPAILDRHLQKCKENYFIAVKQKRNWVLGYENINNILLKQALEWTKIILVWYAIENLDYPFNLDIALETEMK